MNAQHITSKHLGAKAPGRTRILRTMTHVLIADPYAIVTTPLAILFAGFVINGVCSLHEGNAQASWRQLVGEGFYTIAVVVFALLALGHLIAVVVEGWRGSNGSDEQQEGTPRKPVGPAPRVGKDHDGD